MEKVYWKRFKGFIIRLLVCAGISGLLWFVIGLYKDEDLAGMGIMDAIMLFDDDPTYIDNWKLNLWKTLLHTIRVFRDHTIVFFIFMFLFPFEKWSLSVFKREELDYGMDSNKPFNPAYSTSYYYLGSDVSNMTLVALANIIPATVDILL